MAQIVICWVTAVSAPSNPFNPAMLFQIVNAAEMLPALKGTQATRLGLTVEALIHAFNHYGQMVEYLRMNGVVPPASRP